MPDGQPLVLGQNNTSDAATRLYRSGTTPHPAFEAQNQTSGHGVVGSSNDGYGVLGLSQTLPGVYGWSTNAAGVYGWSTNNSGVVGQSANSIGVYGEGTNKAGVEGVSTNASGVHGTSPGGIGMDGFSPNGVGVRGRSADNFGVLGLSTNATGVLGNSANGVGVYGYSANNFAGYFAGNVYVNGQLSANYKLFRIDYPLDPANKYLTHASVESPEMKNFYDGVVELHDDGSAWVGLPEWFEELNGDFRYQLTTLGSPAPELHVAEEVSGNRFRVAGGKAGAKVCWQVTGVRKDRWAQANPMEAEEEKAGEERGRYLHPELYDQPDERGIHRPMMPEGEQGRLMEEVDQQRRPAQPPPLPPPNIDFAPLEGERRPIDEERMRWMS